MKRFGLIGYPVKGSLSPALFQAGYHGRYAYDLIENADFEASYRIFLDRYDGINVTAPYKENAFRRADCADPVCRKIGAANLLVKTDGGIYAYNSDYTGIRRSLLETISGWHPGEAESGAAEAVTRFFGGHPTALIAGCGGAGKAAAVAAADLGMEVCLMNRTVSRAESLASELPRYRFSVRPLENFAEMFWKCDIVIYTLPESIPEIQAPEHGESPLQKAAGSFFPGKDQGNTKVILEANYKTPAFGPAAISHIRKICPGTRYISGLRWLLHQAAGGYELFTGETPDFQSMEKALFPGA